MQRVTPRQITLFIFFALVIFAGVSFLFSNDSSNIEKQIDQGTNFVKKPAIKPSPWVISPDVIQHRATGIRERMETIKTDHNIDKIKEKCSQLTQHQQVWKCKMKFLKDIN